MLYIVTQFYSDCQMGLMKSGGKSGQQMVMLDFSLTVAQTGLELRLSCVVVLSTVIPRLTKVISSGITFVSRNLR